MTLDRRFGLTMLFFGGLLLAFISTGALLQAPLILVCGALGSLGAMALGVRALLGKF